MPLGETARRFSWPGENSRGILRERKDAVYENLRDLNFDYKAGKVRAENSIACHPERTRF
jgi:hypothetical protein